MQDVLIESAHLTLSSLLLSLPISQCNSVVHPNAVVAASSTACFWIRRLGTMQQYAPWSGRRHRRRGRRSLLQRALQLQERIHAGLSNRIFGRKNFPRTANQKNTIQPHNQHLQRNFVFSSNVGRSSFARLSSASLFVLRGRKGRGPRADCFLRVQCSRNDVLSQA